MTGRSSHPATDPLRLRAAAYAGAVSLAITFGRGSPRLRVPATLVISEPRADDIHPHCHATGCCRTALEHLRGPWSRGGRGLPLPRSLRRPARAYRHDGGAPYGGSCVGQRCGGRALTIGGQILLRAGHAPAAATTLLITLGGFEADLTTVGVLIIGIAVTTFLCDGGRRVLTRVRCVVL